MNPTLITRIEAHLDRRQYDPITDSIDLLTEALAELKKSVPKPDWKDVKFQRLQIRRPIEPKGRRITRTSIDLTGTDGGKVSLPQVKP